MKQLIILSCKNKPFKYEILSLLNSYCQKFLWPLSKITPISQNCPTKEKKKKIFFTEGKGNVIKI